MHKLKQALPPAVVVGVYIGRDGYCIHLALGKLCLYVERAYRLYLVAEQVDTERIFRRVSEYIEYGTAHGEMPRLIYIILLLESVFAQPHLRLFQIYLCAGLQHQGMSAQRVARGHPLGQRLRIGYERLKPLPFRHTVERLDAHYLRRWILTSVLDVTFITRREHGHCILSEQP